MRRVTGGINYVGAMDERPRYYAQNHSRDVLSLDPRVVEIEDAREAADPPSLDREGFRLVSHPSSVRNWRDPDEVRRVYTPEIERLVGELTGAARVVITGGGVLRFGERSPDAGTLLNSLPARFVHVDISDPTGESFADRAAPEGYRGRRFAHYNVWRVLSPPPQDVPLTVCDARSVAPEDLVAADAVFDAPGQPEWSFEGLVVRHNPAHRWIYYSGMTEAEALVFTTCNSDPARPHCVPHSAFDDPSCPSGVPPRASIEMRAIAWFD
ncbi:MAG TPA: CmcJ/NvfI family oxidoreductase [Stellaceae bacterium]|nr:CmcJ/NvfI family oxidoreductase [Stellaceae bacterium]